MARNACCIALANHSLSICWLHLVTTSMRFQHRTIFVSVIGCLAFFMVKYLRLQHNQLTGLQNFPAKSKHHRNIKNKQFPDLV
jgi:hypothetical protein